MARKAMSHRILTSSRGETELSGDAPINISGDTVFGFLDDEGSEEGSFESGNDSYVRDEHETEEEEDDDEKEKSGNVQNIKFWESQREMLQTTLCRTTSLESRIRKIAKEVIKEAAEDDEGNICSCSFFSSSPARNGCRKCLTERICIRLQNAGFNSAICKSKWRSSPEIPSGEHKFLDVLDNSNPKKGEIRVIIELNFRGEFEMARAGEEYSQLVRNLPEVFVGKIERLLALITILCSAAKKCMKEKKMHMGPWRKQRYMQAKWLKTCERKTSATPLSTGYSSRPRRPLASMLTVDLLDLPNVQYRTAVEVV